MTTQSPKFSCDILLLQRFVIDNVFNKINHDGEVVLWRDCVGDGEGYVVIFADMSHLHTYKYPPDIWGDGHSGTTWE